MAVDLIFLFGSVALVSLISLVGVVTLSIKEDSLRKILPLFVAFSAGALFGDAFIHLLPKATEKGFTFQISLTVLAGVIVFFVVEKVIHYHHKHSANFQHHLHSEKETEEEKQSHAFTYMNLLGDAVHNFIDGLLIGGSYLVSVPLGISTTIAVILHEIPQEISDFGVLLHGGFSKKKALFFNFLSAITAVLGAIVALIASNFAPSLASSLIPFTAGSFIYIAGSNLIPELHKETRIKTSIVQTIVFLSGVAVMAYLLAFD